MLVSQRVLMALMLVGCGGGSNPGVVDGPPNLIDAPPGSVTTVTKVIGSAGGELAVDGALWTIPPNALTAPTSLTLTKTTLAAPGAFLRTSPVYDLAPHAQTFLVPVTFKITYSTVNLLPGPPSGLMNWLRPGLETGTTPADYESLSGTVVGQDCSSQNSHGAAQVFAGDRGDF